MPPHSTAIWRSKSDENRIFDKWTLLEKFPAWFWYDFRNSCTGFYECFGRFSACINNLANLFYRFFSPCGKYLIIDYWENGVLLGKWRAAFRYNDYLNRFVVLFQVGFDLRQSSKIPVGFFFCRFFFQLFSFFLGLLLLLLLFRFVSLGFPFFWPGRPTKYEFSKKELCWTNQSECFGVFVVEIVGFSDALSAGFVNGMEPGWEKVKENDDCGATVICLLGHNNSWLVRDACDAPGCSADASDSQNRWNIQLRPWSISKHGKILIDCSPFLAGVLKRPRGGWAAGDREAWPGCLGGAEMLGRRGRILGGSRKEPLFLSRVHISLFSLFPFPFSSSSSSSSSFLSILAPSFHYAFWSFPLLFIGPPLYLFRPVHPSPLEKKPTEPKFNVNKKKSSFYYKNHWFIYSPDSSPSIPEHPRASQQRWSIWEREREREKMGWKPIHLLSACDWLKSSRRLLALSFSLGLRGLRHTQTYTHTHTHTDTQTHRHRVNWWFIFACETFQLAVEALGPAAMKCSENIWKCL